MKKVFCISSTALILAAFATAIQAEDLVKVDTVISGLQNPSGIAVQPGTGLIFVSDTAAGRIIRFNPSAPKPVAEDVITGFTTEDAYKKKYHLGPLGLAFVDQKTLVVGGGETVDGKEVVRVYDVPESGKTTTADKAKQTLGPLPATDKIKGEGNFYALAISESMLYVTSNGDDTKGWVLRAKIKADGTFDKLERYLATKEKTELNAPVAITIRPKKGQLVVGQMGPIDPKKDSLLTFYSPVNGEQLMNLELEMYDITGLAYGPLGTKQSELLYGIDFAWGKPEEGALFRIDDNRKTGDEHGAALVKMATLMKPTAIALGKDGAFYVTLFGKDKADGSAEKNGSVVKITPTDKIKDAKGEL